MKRWLKQLFCRHDWVQNGDPVQMVHILSAFSPYADVPRVITTHFRCKRCDATKRETETYPGWQGRF